MSSKDLLRSRIVLATIMVFFVAVVVAFNVVIYSISSSFLFVLLIAFVSCCLLATAVLFRFASRELAELNKQAESTLSGSQNSDAMEANSQVSASGHDSVL